jgi:hypothetical protein
MYTSFVASIHTNSLHIHAISDVYGPTWSVHGVYGPTWSDRGVT